MQAEFRRTKGKERKRESDIEKEKGMTDVEQRVREKRNKSGSTVGGGAEGDLKNGVVKHSTHIVSHLLTLFSRVLPTTRTYPPTSFQPFPPLGRLHSDEGEEGREEQTGEGRRFLIFARFSYR